MSRTYTEVMYHMTRDETRKVEHHYTQAPLDRLVYVLYHAYHEALWRIGSHRVDNLLIRLHQRRCKNDCGIWEIPPDMHEEAGCTYTPWTNAQDCRCFDLNRRGRLNLGQTDLGKTDLFA